MYKFVFLLLLLMMMNDCFVCGVCGVLKKYDARKTIYIYIYIFVVVSSSRE